MEYALLYIDKKLIYSYNLTHIVLLFCIIMSERRIFLKNKLKNALILFVTFLKIGAFTFGGGYAMLPILRREIVEKEKWLTEEEIIDFCVGN